MRGGWERYRHRDAYWPIAGRAHEVHLLMSRYWTGVVRRDFVVLASNRWGLLLLLVESLEGVIAGGSMRRLRFFGLAPKYGLTSEHRRVGTLTHLYRGIPSGPTSTCGGNLKFCLCKYSGLISKEASSGMEDGVRSLPEITSSIA